MITVGDILKKKRLEKGLTLDDIEKNLRVRKKFLLALENNQWLNFSSKVYITGLIKNYAQFLEIDYKKALAYFERDYEKKEVPTFKKSLSDSYFISNSRKVFFAVIFLVFGFFLIYFGYQIKLYFTPPKVEIISPKESFFSNQKVIKLIGQTEKEALIKIGNQRVFQNDKGIFEFNYPLKKGTNQIIIEVIGVNGRKTIIKKEIFNK